MTPEELAEMKQYYANKELPETLQYNDCTMMYDVRKTVNSDILILESFGYTNTFCASWERLTNIRKMIEGEQQLADSNSNE